jgi:hypothetical protein
MYKYECVSEISSLLKKLLQRQKNLTNTYKLTHRNEQIRSKTTYLDVEEFHTPHALSLCIFLSMIFFIYLSFLSQAIDNPSLLSIL